jgi:hypothetical protein
MSKNKTKTARQAKPQKASQENYARQQNPLAVVLEGNNIYDFILISLTIAYFLFYFFKLFSSLENTFFWADENLHAYISMIINKTKSLPAVLPDDIFGGFQYSYPPLFHIFGAAVIGIGGMPGLKFANLIISGLFFIGFYLAILKYYGNREALLACLLISTSPTVAINSVRFVTEMLSMMLICWSFFFLLLALERHSRVHAILAGLSTGLLLLGKQIGVVVLGFYFLLVVWFFFTRKEHVPLMIIAIGAAVCVYFPYVIWAVFNRLEVFGFISVFLGTKPEWVTNAVKSFRKYDSAIKEFASLFYNFNGIVITASFLVPLYHCVRTRARDFPHNYIFLITIYLAGVMVVWHITNARHTITLLPLMAFLFGYSLHKMITNKIVIRLIIVLLLIAGCYHAYFMPNYRQMYNGPEAARSLAQYIKNDRGTNGRTLVIEAFDYFMYSGKPTIWLYPNLRNIPFDLFEKQTPEKLYSLLKHYNIDFIVIDTQHISVTDDVTVHTYPLSFVRNCEKLDQQGKLSLKLISDSKNILLLQVI